MNRPLKSSFLLIVMSLILSACSSTPKVNTDADPAFSFAGLKSFYLVPHNATARIGEQGASLVDQRIADALKREMKGRGLKEVDENSADFLLSYYVVTEDKTRVTSYNNNSGYYGYRAGYRYGWGGATNVDVTQYTEGTLIVDLVYPAEKRVVWRGASSAVIRQRTTAERVELINGVVAAIVAEMPAF